MHLSFLSHEFPPIGGGASSALDALTKKLAQRGHSIQILAIGMDEKTTHEKDRFDRVIIRFACGRRRIMAPSAWELLRSYLVLRYSSVPFVRSFRPDALTAFFAFPSGHAAIALKRRFTIPLIVSLRGSDVPGFSDARWGIFRFIRTTLLRPVWKQADLLLANGNRLLYLADTFIRTGKVFNLPNGVDTDIYQPPMRRHTDNHMRILFVGQLIGRKRCIEMLEGIEWLAGREVSAEMTIVGDGPLRPEIEARASRIQDRIRIHIMRPVERDRMPELYQRHDVLILLSRAEGISNVLLEALASGLCVVTSDTASQDVLGGKRAGIRLDRITPQNIGDALFTLGQNRDIRQQMQTEARKLAEGFSWTTTAISFENHVSRILGTGEPHHNEDILC
ncbi:MAG: glycosyltransferase family 4 protein [bacterium]